MQPPNDGRTWYAHDGRAMPVAFNRMVVVLYRSGYILGPREARSVSWYTVHFGTSPVDIMYYAIETPYVHVSDSWDVIAALLEVRGR